MISAVRSRIKKGGLPANQTAAKILFKLVAEEDSYCTDDVAEDNAFESLVLEQHPEDLYEGTESTPTADDVKQDEQAFTDAGGQ